MTGYLDRFDRDVSDGNDLQWHQLLLFAPLTLLLVARAVLDALRCSAKRDDSTTSAVPSPKEPTA